MDSNPGLNITGTETVIGQGTGADGAVFRTLLDRMTDGVFIARDYRFIFANAALPRMLGYEHDDFVGLGFDAVVAPDFLELWVQRFRQRTGDGEEPPGRYELRFRMKGGRRELPIELNASRVVFDGQRCVLGIVRDMSGRKLAEHALRESEQRFRGTFDQAAVGIALMDLEGRFLRVNPKLCDILGFRASELRTLTMEAITHPEDISLDIHPLRCVRSGEQTTYSIEKRLLHKSGTATWARLTISLLLDEMGAPSHFIAVIEDVHDRHLAQTALADSELRHRLLMHNLHAAVLVCAPDARILYGNPEACRILRMDSALLAGRTIAQLGCRFIDQSGEALAPERDLVRRVLVSGQEMNDVVVGVRHDDADTLWVLVHAYPEFDTQHRLRHIVVMFVDITDRSRLEAERDADRQLKTAALNAITAHVAVLDKRGVIVETNSSWRAFAERGGYTGNMTFIGVNYLDALARCDRDEAPHAEAACEGILSVMLGRSALFQMEYACHAPHERQWFSLKVTPMDAARERVLLSHENITRIKLAEEAVRILANTDALTGLANRRHFFEVAEEEFVRARRYGTPLTVLMADLDHFKRINDHFGHAGGDAVLCSFAIILSSLLRDSDSAGRLGGEEFAVLLPHTALDGARAFAERLMERVAENPPEFDGQPAHYTLSIGIGELMPDCLDFSALLRKADEALYRAKSGGRNRVEYAPGPCNDAT
ncbi:MAG: PAS domain S-box protein [Methyloversatilis sp.]|nr:PAS domain S-box protein [Methyloversatilis sp.]MCR6665897.1 PAS domain S-box protein [Methyloversatilis sp.]